MGSKFTVKKSRIQGMGCFATAPIKKGELIHVMSGKKISFSAIKKKYRVRNVRIADPFQISEGQYILLGKPSIYFNHSCRPNAAIVGIGKLIALKNIKKGEEITYDYSATEWSIEYWKRVRSYFQILPWKKYPAWGMKCDCGAASCRKTVKDFSLLPKKLQEKYIKNNAVQDFIIRKYRKHKKRSGK